MRICIPYGSSRVESTLVKNLTKKEWLCFLEDLAKEMKREDFSPEDQPKFTYRDVKNNLRIGKTNDNLTRDEWAEKWVSRVLNLDVLKDEWAAFLRGSKELSLFTDLHCYHNLLAKPNLEKKRHHSVLFSSCDFATCEFGFVKIIPA